MWMGGGQGEGHGHGQRERAAPPFRFPRTAAELPTGFNLQVQEAVLGSGGMAGGLDLAGYSWLPTPTTSLPGPARTGGLRGGNASSGFGGREVPSGADEGLPASMRFGDNLSTESEGDGGGGGGVESNSTRGDYTPVRRAMIHEEQSNGGGPSNQRGGGQSNGMMEVDKGGGDSHHHGNHKGIAKGRKRRNSGGDKDVVHVALEDEDKTERRKRRNRESAAQHRQKKQDHIDRLEARVAELTEENRRLRAIVAQRDHGYAEYLDTEEGDGMPPPMCSPVGTPPAVGMPSPQEGGPEPCLT